MNIIYIDNRGERREQTLEQMTSALMMGGGGAATFHEARKERQYALLHKALEAGVVPVLFDPKMEVIAEKVAALGIENYDVRLSGGSGLPEDAYALFFTSGTTGTPVGAIKSESNIRSELTALKRLFASQRFERVIVTVPFIHIYGFLAGVLLPQALGCEVLFKQDYFPYDLMNLHEGKKSLVVTSPVFIKSMLRLRQEANLANMTFLSSTGLLLEDEIEAFETKYNTSVVQLFGSTETGGIAFKRGVTRWWEPLEAVEVSWADEGCMAVTSPYISRYLWRDTVTLLEQPFATTDLITLEAGRFALEGRLSEIIKISGKRLSAGEIEQLIEKELAVKEALVRTIRDSRRLKDEMLQIDLSGAAEVEKAQVETLLKAHYSGIHFEFELRKVEAVEKNAMGKKVRQ